MYIKMTDGTRVKIFSGQLFTFKDRSRVLAQRQILSYLALDERVSSDEYLPDGGLRLTPPPSTARGGQMQRRITGILGRGGRRLKMSLSSDNLTSAVDAQLNDTL